MRLTDSMLLDMGVDPSEPPEYDPEAPDPTVCYNCGCPGRFMQGGEYKCPNCGNIWDIYEPPPEVP